MRSEDPTTVRLAALLRLTLPIVLSFAMALALVSWVTGIQLIQASLIVTIAFAATVRIAQYQLDRGERTRATYWIGGGGLASAVLLTAIVPALYTSNAVVPLLVATVMLQFAPYQHSHYYLVVCGLMTVVIVALGLSLPHSSVSARVIMPLNTSLLVTNIGLALFMLWQFRMRLQETITDVQQINRVLTSLNSRLQRELHERQRTEAALQASERRIRALLNAVPDALFRIHRDGHILDIKPIEQVAGLEDDPRALTDVQALLPPREWVERAIATRQTQRYESQLVLKNSVYDFEGRIVVSDDEEVVAIVRDVTEVKLVERMKTEFISTVSHELRTPITAIRGSLGLIIGGVTGTVPAEARSMLDIAQRNCDRLLRLVNDILDMEQLERGKLAMNLHAHALVPLIEHTIASHRAYGEQFKVAIQIEGDLAAVRICTDPDRFVQALTNLLSNAVKFSPPQGIVRVATTVNGSTVRITVADQGPGIPETFRGRIFQRFAQADGSDQRRAQGSGLGLSIAKAIVEQSGGTIGFVTEEGHGTTFHLEFPIVEPM